MKVEITHLKRCDLVKLEGRIDSSNASELEKALREVMSQGVYHIILDMGDVEYFGSAAIRALVMAYKECRRWNRGDVRLARVPERICRVLELAGILPLIQTFPDETLAVGSF